MKLYVKSYNGKQYLNNTASTRQHLADIIGSPWFEMDGQTYHVSDVYAEDGDNSAAAGVIIGGLLGLLAGPAGVIGGGLLGGLIGNESDSTDSQRVRQFNNSWVLK